MSHADGHNVGQQLAMWMTPKEVGDMWSGDVWPERVRDSPDIMRGRWSEHRDGYRRSGLDQEQYLSRLAASPGADHPVTVGWVGPHPHLVDGHHRYMLAQRSGALIPVEHQEGLS